MSKNIDWNCDIPSTQYTGPKWLGRYKAGPYARVELRRSFRHTSEEDNMYAQALLVVRAGDSDTTLPELTLSMNGTMPLNMAEMKTLNGAIIEAKIRLDMNQENNA